jgi:hypothetical protein
MIIIFIKTLCTKSRSLNETTIIRPIIIIIITFIIFGTRREIHRFQNG